MGFFYSSPLIPILAALIDPETRATMLYSISGQSATRQSECYIYHSHIILQDSRQGVTRELLACVTLCMFLQLLLLKLQPDIYVLTLSPLIAFLVPKTSLICYCSHSSQSA